MTYPGGKEGAGVYQWIINHMPAHSLYIEPFLGGGAILRLKKPAQHSIAIEIDAQVVSSFPPMADVEVRQGCGIEYLRWISRVPRPDALIYCDPPYLRETCKSRSRYRYAFTDQQHAELLSIIRNLQFQVMISGYWSQLYAEALSGWHVSSFETTTRGGSRATEWLWCNFAPAVQLHDTRYLGANFRERERIKRKTERWKRRLRAMPAQERYALMVALQDIDRSSLSVICQNTRSTHHSRYRVLRRPHVATPASVSLAERGPLSVR